MRKRGTTVVKKLTPEIGLNDTYGATTTYDFAEDEILVSVSVELENLTTGETITISVWFDYEDGTSSTPTEIPIDADGFYYLTEYFMSTHLNKPIIRINVQAKTNQSSTNATLTIYLRNIIR